MHVFTAYLVPRILPRIFRSDNNIQQPLNVRITWRGTKRKDEEGGRSTMRKITKATKERDETE